MAHDLLLKGGRMYDGSGLPSYLGDVAVQDGRVVETGRISGERESRISNFRVRECFSVRIGSPCPALRVVFGLEETVTRFRLERPKRAAAPRMRI